MGHRRPDEIGLSRRPVARGRWRSGLSDRRRISLFPAQHRHGQGPASTCGSGPVVATSPRRRLSPRHDRAWPLASTSGMTGCEAPDCEVRGCEVPPAAHWRAVGRAAARPSASLLPPSCPAARQREEPRSRSRRRGLPGRAPPARLAPEQVVFLPHWPVVAMCWMVIATRPVVPLSSQDLLFDADAPGCDGRTATQFADGPCRHWPW